ncbi:MAG TPA: EfeM/EfeO family lipoprotein [Pseudolabrys sp.]|jgi:iron uptake system EfeUOB component EfeO/EfeM|nr:EfeM/EfeO family lipoprotein [Pseudolabrys sp.]HEX2538860.1 EfeM/EfeO family lipoprotein [Pseudolabrys sp.]
MQSFFRFSRGALIASALALTAGAAQAASMAEGVKSYKPFVVEHIGKAIAGAKDMQSAVKAGNLEAAQKAWIASRKGWEAMEPVTGTYFGDLDKLIDAWPDAKSGYHAIEVVLFSAKKTEGLDQQIADLLVNMDTFQKRVGDKKFGFAPQKLLEGTANLAYEVGEEKSGGGESPFAATSIVDMQENVEGIEVAWKVVFADTLKKKDPKLAGLIHERIENLETLVKAADIKSMDARKVHVAGEELAALMLQAAPKLGLKPFKVGDEDGEKKDEKK